jgi:hypothetical protein
MEVATRPVPSLSAVFQSAWRVTVTNLLPVIVLTLVVNIPINAVLALFPISEDAGLQEWSRYFRTQRALQFWIGTIGILGVVHLTVATYRGVRLSISDAFSRAFSNYGSALWAQLIYSAAVVLGLLLLVIPGIAIAVFWYFSLQAIVIHKLSGWQALKHSRQMVKGRWWAYFGKLAVLYAFMILAILVLSIPTWFMPKTFLLGIITMIPIDLVASFFTVCFTELYLNSEREVRELEPLDNVAAPP